MKDNCPFCAEGFDRCSCDMRVAIESVNKQIKELKESVEGRAAEYRALRIFAKKIALMAEDIEMKWDQLKPGDPAKFVGKRNRLHGIYAALDVLASDLGLHSREEI